jgi:hypothetical protein
MDSGIRFGYTHCPKCGADLDGGMIPVERRGLYDGSSRYSRLDGPFYDQDDRQESPMRYFICPDCDKEFVG